MNIIYEIKKKLIYLYYYLSTFRTKLKRYLIRKEQFIKP